MSPYYAAMRDASWYNSPGRAGRYHMIDAKTGRSLCGRVLLDNEGTRIELNHVGLILRRRRAGCSSHWPTP